MSSRHEGALDRAVAANRLREYFEGNSDGVACVWLFGSTARGTDRAGSDLDVGVLLDRDPPATLAGSAAPLAAALERFLGREVDVVLLNRAPVDLVHRVLRDGVIVYERLPRVRIAFEVRSRSAFFDMKPILDRYRRTGTPADG